MELEAGQRILYRGVPCVVTKKFSGAWICLDKYAHLGAVSTQSPFLLPYCEIGDIVDLPCEDRGEVTAIHSMHIAVKSFKTRRKYFVRGGQYTVTGQPTPRWEPDEEEIRELCGTRVNRSGKVVHVTIEDLREYRNYGHAWSAIAGPQGSAACKIEPIPECEIPKSAPAKEKYEIKFPLLAGYLE